MFEFIRKQDLSDSGRLQCSLDDSDFLSVVFQQYAGRGDFGESVVANVGSQTDLLAGTDGVAWQFQRFDGDVGGLRCAVCGGIRRGDGQQCQFRRHIQFCQTLLECRGPVGLQSLPVGRLKITDDQQFSPGMRHAIQQCNRLIERCRNITGSVPGL